MRKNLALKFFGLAILSLGAFLYFSQNIGAFSGPSGNPSSGGGVISSDASNNLAIGTSTTQANTRLLVVASTTGTGDYAIKIVKPDGSPILFMRGDGIVSVGTASASSTLTVDGTIFSSGNFTGTLSAANLTSGVFNGATGGNYAFNGSLGVGTTTQVGLPAVLTVYATSSFFGKVGINTASPAGAFEVRGTQDINQLIVRAHSTQTNPPVQIRNSAGTETFRIQADSTKATAYVGGFAGGTGSGMRNTMAGYAAGANLSTGEDNTGVGAYVMQDSIVSGNFNSAVGSYALGTLADGDYNSALGYAALGGTGDGSYNTGMGANSLFSNWNGSYNTALGANALNVNQNGNFNTAVGESALYSNTTSSNTAVGYRAAYSGTTGGKNVAIGYQALHSATSSEENVAIGYRALASSTPAYGPNVAIGANALGANTRGYGNIAIGQSALAANTVAYDNIAIGNGALAQSTVGQFNVGIGASTLGGVGTSSYNVAIGAGALPNPGGGGRNVAVGYAAGMLGGYTDSVAIGYRAMRDAQGSYNTAIGSGALFGEGLGEYNTALGYSAMNYAAYGSRNTAIGVAAMQNVVFDGSDENVALGYYSLDGMGSGKGNTAVGSYTDLGGGNYSVALGYNAGVTAAAGGATSSVFIGPNAGRGITGGATDKLYIANRSTSTLIYGDFANNRVAIGTTTASAALTVAGDIYATGNVTCGGSCGGSTAGYALQCYAHLTSLGDATTYHMCGKMTVAWSTATSGLQLYIPQSGTIKSAFVMFNNSTQGSGETSSIYIRKNDSTDTLISNSLTHNATSTVASNTGLSIPVSQGDYIHLKLVTPTWTTNPTVYTNATLYIQTN